MKALGPLISVRQSCESLILCRSTCRPHCRHHPGIRPAALQHVLPRCDLLFLPWRVTDEDASDVGASFAGVQSYHRCSFFPLHINI